MTPALALCLTIGFLCFLFWRESRQKREESRALWIPFLWLFIIGSRYFSQWLGTVGVNIGASSIASSLEDGSPVDRLVFIGLIVAGLYVLSKRHVQLSQFRQQNVWLTVFLVYCCLSIVWSDFPLVAFKRWIKVLGHPIMVLIILTEPNPEKAVQKVLKRVGYLLIPLSVLLGKYFPQLGRNYDMWTGTQYFIGATTDKNALGHLCMILGVFFFWNALQALRIKNPGSRRYEFLLSMGFLVMTGWLLKMSNSATSLLTMSLGILTIALLGLPFVNKRKISIYFLGAIIFFAAANSMFDIYATVVHGVGRNLTLTDRTNIWGTVLKLQPDPIFGVGFESFWLGDRLLAVWRTLPGEMGISEAHNGYLETYLNLGIVGLSIFASMLLATYFKICRDLVRRFEFGRLRMGLFIAIISFNFTEAAFVNLHFIYAIFFLIAVEYPMVRRSRLLRSPAPVRKEAEREILTAEGALSRPSSAQPCTNLAG